VIGRRVATPMTYSEHLEEEVESGWRGRVLAAGWAAEELVPQLEEDRALRALVDRVAPLDRALYLAMDRAMIDLEVRIYSQALLVGYALAATRLTSTGKPDRWPARALAHAGLAGEEFRTESARNSDSRSAVERESDPAPAGYSVAEETAPSDPAGAGGETFEAVLAVAGSAVDVPERDLPQLLARGLWLGSTGAARYEELDARIVALTERGESVDAETFDEVDDQRTQELVDTSNAAALVGYSLGRTEGLSEAERIRRARAFAGLEPAPPAPPRDGLVVDQIAEWLRANCPWEDETPEAAAARLLREVPALAGG
jgi:hypothetical protein